MDDKPRTQQDMADLLAEALTATAGELARSRPQLPVTAASPEVVDAVRILTHLGRHADDWPSLCYRAMCGTVAREEWARLASVLRSAAEACQLLASGVQVVDEDRGCR